MFILDGYCYFTCKYDIRIRFARIFLFRFSRKASNHHTKPEHVPTLERSRRRKLLHYHVAHSIRMLPSGNYIFHWGTKFVPFEQASAHPRQLTY